MLKFYALALRQALEMSLLCQISYVNLIDEYKFLAFTVVRSRGYQHARFMGRQQHLEQNGSEQPL